MSNQIETLESRTTKEKEGGGTPPLHCRRRGWLLSARCTSVAAMALRAVPEGKTAHIMGDALLAVAKAEAAGLGVRPRAGVEHAVTA